MYTDLWKHLKRGLLPQIVVATVTSVNWVSRQWEVQTGRLLIDNPASRGRMSFSFLVNKSFPSSVPLQTRETLIDLCSLNESRVWKMSTALKAATLSLETSAFCDIAKQARNIQPAAFYWWRNQSLLIYFTIKFDLLRAEYSRTQAARIMWTDPSADWG